MTEFFVQHEGNSNEKKEKAREKPKEGEFLFF